MLGTMLGALSLGFHLQSPLSWDRVLSPFLQLGKIMRFGGLSILPKDKTYMGIQICLGLDHMLWNHYCLCVERLISREDRSQKYP